MGRQAPLARADSGLAAGVGPLVFLLMSATPGLSNMKQAERDLGGPAARTKAVSGQRQSARQVNHRRETEIREGKRRSPENGHAEGVRRRQIRGILRGFQDGNFPAARISCHWYDSSRRATGVGRCRAPREPESSGSGPRPQVDRPELFAAREIDHDQLPLAPREHETEDHPVGRGGHRLDMGARRDLDLRRGHQAPPGRRRRATTGRR